MSAPWVSGKTEASQEIFPLPCEFLLLNPLTILFCSFILSSFLTPSDSSLGLNLDKVHVWMTTVGGMQTFQIMPTTLNDTWQWPLLLL